MDNAWKQKKLEARKMLGNAAESHPSSARFVGSFTQLTVFKAGKNNCHFCHQILLIQFHLFEC